MRKWFLLMCCVGLFLPTMTFAAETEEATDTVATEKKQGIHPYKEVSPLADETAHWSITAGGAILMLDGDFVQPNITIIPKTRVRPSGTFELTYDFNPLWGISGLYSYGPYGIRYDATKQGGGEDDWLLKGHMHSMELLIHFDLIDAWFPQRKNTIFSLYFMAGLGLGVYNSDYLGPKDDYSSYPYTTPRADGRYDMAGIVSAGLAAEFNITRSLGLGVKGLYRMFTTDRLDTKTQGVSNDCMEYASLYLRWKIEASKKNHVRNYASDDVLAALLAPVAIPQKDTVCISSKDTVVVEKEPVIVKQNMEDRFYVYFDNDKYILKDEALQIIQQVTDRLEEDSTLCLEITGFCDHPASDEYNQTLSENRANRVAQEFQDVYGLSESQIYTSGQGRILNVKNSYSPNRRAEIRLRTQEEIDALKEAEQAEKEEAAAAEAEVTNTPLADREVLATITSDANTTFARLAHKYYGNSYCWPYIYAANQKIVLNNQPDKIMRDVEIIIPTLTQSEIDAANVTTAKQMVADIQGK